MPKRDRDVDPVNQDPDLAALLAIPAAEENPIAGSGDDESEDNAFDNITEQEEEDARMEELDEMGHEFLDWLGPDGADSKKNRVVTQQDVDKELSRIGLVESDYLGRPELFCERLQEIDIIHRRSFEVGNKTCLIDTFAEAKWIIQQLAFTAHGMLNDGALRAHAHRGDWTHPAVEEISTVLQLLHEGIEPSLIAVHHQHKLRTLEGILWTTDRYNAARNDHLPDSGMAVNARTGQRQMPDARGSNLFTFTAQTPSITGDGAWHERETADRSIRKPTDIQLGRLIWVIADLDHQLYRYEKNRQTILSNLEKFGHSDAVGWHHRKLEDSVFEGPIDSAAWKQYEIHCQQAYGTGTQSALSVIINSNLLEDFSNYMLPPHEFATNVDDRMNVYPLPAALPLGQSPLEWAGSIGANLEPQRSATSVLGLFNKATIDILSHDPVIIHAVYNAYKEHGLCVVSLDGESKSFKLSDLFDRNPVQYLQLLEGDRATLRFLIPAEKLAAVLKPTQLLDAPADGADQNAVALFDYRSRAMIAATTQLREFVSRQLEIELHRDAQALALRQSQERFGRIIAEGPYEPSTLSFSHFPKLTPSLWDSNWNAVEAVRSGDEDDSALMKGQARICGVFRANNDVTSLVCCDESGMISGYVRWVDCAENTVEGKAIADAQMDALFKLFANCQPNAIAIAATNGESRQLFRTLERFVKERVHPGLHYHLPVVWVEAEVSISVSWSAAANAEFPSGDAGLRTAVSLARYLRDPLLEICRLFHEPTDSLTLPLAHLYAGKIPQSAMVRALQRELSLWMAAVAPEINHVLRLSQPSLVLQFFPGLGPITAPLLQRRIELHSQGMVNGRDHLEALLEGSNPAISKNIVTGTRVVLPATTDDANQAHILDCTLIPEEHYDTALDLAKHLAKTRGSAYHSHGQAAVMELWMKPEHERYTMLCKLDLASYVTDNQMAYVTTGKVDFSYGLLSFIMDELCNKGESTMRRTFRPMSDITFLRVTTGVVWAERRTPALDLLGEVNVLCVGDVIPAVPIKGKPGMSDHHDGVLMLNTQSGLSAMMDIDSIQDGEIHHEIKEHVKQNLPKLPDALRANGKPRPIYGRIKSLNLQRGELRLEWAPTPTPAGAVDAGLPTSRYNADVTSVGDDDQSVKTIETVKLLNAAKTHATKISRHELYRNVNHSTASRMLVQSMVGTYLLHSSSRDPRRAYVVLKAGNCIKPLNFPLEEFQRSDGTIAYRYTNQRTNTSTEFDDPDHCFAKLIDRVVTNVNVLMNDKNYLPTPSLATLRQMLEQQKVPAQNRGTQLAYVITENVDLASGDKLNPSNTSHTHPYLLHYFSKTNSKVKHVRISVEEAFHIRLDTDNHQMCFSVPEMIAIICKHRNRKPQQ